MNSTAVCLVLLHLVVGFHLLSAYSKCTRPKSISHASASVEPWETEFVEGTSIKYTCDAGYSGEGDNEARCVSVQGRTDWSQTKFACKDATKRKESSSWKSRFSKWWQKKLCSVNPRASCDAEEI